MRVEVTNTNINKTNSYGYLFYQGLMSDVFESFGGKGVRSYEIE